MKWIETSEEILYEFVKQHGLKEIPDGMHSTYVDNDGTPYARSIHGFASNMCSIYTTENEETLAVVDSIINKY